MNKHNINYVNNIKDLIEKSSSIALISHKDPDGDCLGSLLGLYNILFDRGIESDVYLDSGIPDNYAFLPGLSKINSKPGKDGHDLVIVLDCSDLDRTGNMKEVFHGGKKSVCIDHHESNLNFCDINIVEENCSSTGEMIYKMSSQWGYEVGKDSAVNLYTAILTDTGKFIYDKTTPDTFRCVAELVEKGIDFTDIVDNVYGSEDRRAVLAKSKILSEAEFFYNGKLSIGCVSQKILEDYDVEMKNIDGLVESLRDIKDVEISCILKETGENSTKVSLRSKGDINVSKISRLFNGGGHAKAAGFTLKNNIFEAKDIVVEKLKEFL
ncbi:phosphoesterase RecJ domain-containing protein [Dethiosulfatibacter aminovorans DSM 17477]|uniref:Phosphoesterase RecJ domain-containing protein n=1 Tax=Dethiosulfatibacter aminovorans DSM 17477 TaxID=1121476 RepID=A0A1M6DDL6_9FIRM|nr:bifunctional oligoribonuclease/PAP phosphatase NrnA [Dethiosulfatibacter aminovorans]SHI71260.1 phosphoesterase RecJ domain-containing protein [Dethiosulfatibacter aminovorans DSM 17477]